jgi:hypothetical protein
MASYPVKTPHVGPDGGALQAIRQGAKQNVSYNGAGGASTQSVPFGAKTRCVRIALHVPSTGTGVRVEFGANPVAIATSVLYPGSAIDFWDVDPGWMVAVISDDANTGTINVIEAATT